MLAEDFKIETPRLIITLFDENHCEAISSIQDTLELDNDEPSESSTNLNDAYEFVKFAKWLYGDDEERKWFRYFWAIFIKTTNTLIGYCGLGNPEFDSSLVEIYCGIDRQHWGKGYATEITQALLNYGFTELNLEQIVAFAEKDDPIAFRVLEKAGMLRTGEITDLNAEFDYFNGKPLFAIRKVEWDSKNIYESA